MILPLLTALRYYKLKEIVGDENNPIIVKMFKEIGHAWIKNDETAWCAAFLNYVLKISGYPYTGKLNARSFLGYGENVDTCNAKVGDIVVFWRVKKYSPYGHVGFYISEDENYYYILGGNQNNEVNISPYPKSKLLSIRRYEGNN